MKYICDVESIVNKGKIDPEAASTINKLKENDSITIISSNNNITLPIDVINALINTSANVSIKECSNAYSLCLSIGMELGAGSEAHLIFKGPTFGSIKNTVTSQNPNLVIGWAKNSKIKTSYTKKTTKSTSKAPSKQAVDEQLSLEFTQIEEKAAKKADKKAKEVKDKDDFAMPKPTSDNAKLTKKGRPKKEKAIEKATNKPQKEVSSKESVIKETPKKEEKNVDDSNNIEKIKNIVGSKYSAKDYKTMEKIIIDSSDDSELGLLFACRIHLSSLYEEEGFTDKLKEAYHAIRG